MDRERKKKGQIAQGVSLVAALIFVGILLGAGAIALGSFQSNYEASLDSNHSLWTYGQSAVVGTVGNASSGVVNISTQMPTIGTIGGVALIIGMLFAAVGVYVFGRQE